MKSSRNPARSRGAYTLLELMVGIGTASSIFAIILTSGVAIYRSCSAATDYSVQANDQLRSIDYIKRDLHHALSVTVPFPGALSLTVPDLYSSYDDGGIPIGPPVEPTIIDGVPTYGDPAQPVAVNYFVNDHALIREQTVPAAGTTTRLVVATGVSSLDLTAVPLSTMYKITLNFLPRTHQGVTGLRPGATATATVAARMLKAK